MTYPHLSVLIQKQAEKYGDRIALRYRDYSKEEWIPVSWNEFSATVRKVSDAMIELGVGVQENMGVFSQNKPEYLYTDFGAYGIRAVTIPLYATSSESQVQYIINDAEIRYLFVGEQYQYDVAWRVHPLCRSLKKIIIFDPSVKKRPDDTTSVYFNELLTLGEGGNHAAEVEKRTADAVDTDIANILYTSGTTGNSKGVVLLHSCYQEQFRTHDIRLKDLSDKDVSMCFLPLTHIFERGWTYVCLMKGCEVCINLRPQDIQKTIKEVRPTVMCSVPRFWEKVYAGVQEKIGQTTGVAKKMMLDAIRVGRIHNVEHLRRGLTPPLPIRLKYSLYEKTIYRLLKKTIGIENGNFFPTAGAAVPPAVEEFVNSVGIRMMVGYGLTESTATVTCDDFSQTHQNGSIGRVMPGLELKIGEDNEILLRGKSICAGYYKNEEATKAAFDKDGFFHTGDAGYIKDGEVFLTERIKDLFKTSNGKYIAPQMLETKLVVDRYIDQIAIIADQRKFVSALIVPEYGLVKAYAKEKGIAYDSMTDLLLNNQIIEMFKNRIDTLQQEFAHYEQVKRFTLLPEPFSMERGELTNTLKIKRPVLNKNYADIIQKMYEE